MSNKTFNLFGIFRSKTRTLLLINFFVNPDKEFYTRQLEKDLKTPASIIHRELKRLEESRLIVPRNLGNLILYKIDKESPYYPELRELTLKISGIDILIKPIIEREKDIAICFIYGSYARGDFDASSDIDIFMIVKDGEGLYEKISSNILKFEEMLGREFNLDYMSIEEFKKRLRKKDPYISDILKNPKLFIKGGESDIRFSNS